MYMYINQFDGNRVQSFVIRSRRLGKHCHVENFLTPPYIKGHIKVEANMTTIQFIFGLSFKM